MKKNKFLLCMFIFSLSAGPVFPYSARHHLIDALRYGGKVVSAPLKGIFRTGPENIHDAYTYEVREREKPEERGLLRYKLFALWRAPGEEAKGMIDGLMEGISSGGSMLKSLLSIFFSD